MHVKHETEKMAIKLSTEKCQDFWCQYYPHTESSCPNTLQHHNKEDFISTLGPLRGSSPAFSPLSWRGLNPIKPVYDPDQPDGQLNLTASAFNLLGQYTSSPGRRGILCRTRRLLP